MCELFIRFPERRGCRHLNRRSFTRVKGPIYMSLTLGERVRGVAARAIKKRENGAKAVSYRTGASEVNGVSWPS